MNDLEKAALKVLESADRLSNFRYETDVDLIVAIDELRAALKPWETEPDEDHWVDGHTGLQCHARRNDMGVWCGYVDLPEGHPWYGQDYDEISADAHGGLTYAAPQGDVWRVGFDCNHWGDYAPCATYSQTDGTYRTLEYVRDQCEVLADQIAAKGQEG